MSTAARAGARSSDGARNGAAYERAVANGKAATSMLGRKGTFQRETQSDDGSSSKITDAKGRKAAVRRAFS